MAIYLLCIKSWRGLEKGRVYKQTGIYSCSCGHNPEAIVVVYGHYRGASSMTCNFCGKISSEAGEPGWAYRTLFVQINDPDQSKGESEKNDLNLPLDTIA